MGKSNEKTCANCINRVLRLSLNEDDPAVFECDEPRSVNFEMYVDETDSCDLWTSKSGTSNVDLSGLERLFTIWGALDGSATTTEVNSAALAMYIKGIIDAGTSKEMTATDHVIALFQEQLAIYISRYAGEKDVPIKAAFAYFCANLAANLDLTERTLESVNGLSAEFQRTLTFPGETAVAVVKGASGELGTLVHPNIGGLVAEDNTEESTEDQRHYAIETLIGAAAALCADQHKNGTSLEDIISHIVESFGSALEAEIPDISIKSGIVDARALSDSMVPKNGGKGNMPS